MIRVLRRFPIIIPVLAAVALGGAAPPSLAPAADDIQFNRDIRPILSNNCFQCHGPDAEKQEAGLRLDSFEGATAERDGGFAIKPGDLKASAVWSRINETDPDMMMPPPATTKKLTDADREKLRRWILAGAKYEKHWSFETPKRADPPATKFADQVLQPTDAFLFARLEKEGLAPSALAEKSTLLRRVTFDLTGLPPTLEELDAFIADDSPDAYEKQVDRLLSSPRYGEHLASWWCDLARYADTNGFQNDFVRMQWRWRDWVIDAFNANKPFNEFTVEQLAGDLLPNPTLPQRIATGFNRNNRTVTEAGSISEEWRAEYVVDRIETTASVFMGLTMGCCRCHDHKFDPITQKDFYQFGAYFNNVAEEGLVLEKAGNVAPKIPAPLPDQAPKLAELIAVVDAAKAEAKPSFDAADAGRLAWENWLKDTSKTEAPGLVWRAPLNGDLNGTLNGAPTEFKSSHKKFPWEKKTQFGRVARFFGVIPALWPVNAGQSLDLEGAPPVDGSKPFSVAAWIFLQKPKNGGTVVSCMDEANAFRGWDLQIFGGPVFHLISKWSDDGLKVRSKKELAPNEWQHVVMTYDGSRKASGVAFFINGAPCETEILNDTLTGDTTANQPVRIGLRTKDIPFRGQLHDVRFYDSAIDASARDQALVWAYERLARLPFDDRSEKQQEALVNWYRPRFSPEAKAAYDKLLAVDAEREKYEITLPSAMVMEDLPEPREMFIFKRGQYDQHGEQVFANTPSSLPPLPENSVPNRLAMANWLVSPEHPLTSRVIVNRIWDRLFGIGLSKSIDDLGSQGEPPVHPELLDWLACEFMQPTVMPSVAGQAAQPWDLKALQKMLVMSAAYRQSSTVPPGMQERDPDNRLVARGPRFRLSAEAVRDQALAASGLLVEKIGGPSVKPYQPAGVWEELAASIRYAQDKGESLYRRTLYTYIRRTTQQPSLALFDAPNREVCVIKRARTNTPLQALCLQNDKTYVEAARKLAEQMMAREGTAEERLGWGFRRVTSRQARSEELEILARGFARRLEEYQKNPTSAANFLSVGDSASPDSLDKSELAAYTTVASVMLNLDEVITRQ